MKTRQTMRGTTAVAMVAVALLSGCAEKPEALVASAKGFLAKNDPAAAILQLKNALQENPDLAEARFLLGKAELDTGQYAGAQKEFRKALELRYSTDQVIPPLAETMLRSGEGKSAIAEFGKIELTIPEARAELQTTLGKAHLALRDPEASKSAFAAAIAAIPDYPPALLGLAQLTAGRGDLPGAMTLVESALAKSPTLADGWQLKGDILVAQGQVEPGLAAYRKAVETKPDQLAARYRIVTLLMQQDKTEEAGNEFAAMKKIAPANPQTLYLQAMLAFRNKDYVGAREAIQLNLRAAPGNPAGLLLGAQIDYQLGSYSNAEAALATLLQQAPRHVFARRLLVRVHLREGRPRKALEVLRPLLQDTQPDSNTLALAGDVYIQNGDIAEAARYFDRSASLDPENATKRTTATLARVATGKTTDAIEELQAAAAADADVRADLALIATNVRLRNFDAALRAIAALEKKQPGKPLPHSLRGAVLMAKTDFTGARQSYERALAIDGTYFPAAANLARLDLIEKQPAEAPKRFDAILAKDPKNVQALLAIAGLRSQAGGSTDEVAALIRKAVDAKPSETEPWVTLIGHYLKKNEPKKAVAAAQEATAALPGDPGILDVAGQAYRAAGDTSQAIGTYQKLAQLQPDSTLPFMRLAQLYVAAKDNAAALSNLRKALAIKPDLVEAQRAIIALDFRSGRTSEALAAARAIQKQHPKESTGYVAEGDIHYSTKAWSDAVAAYRTGLKQAGTIDLAMRLYLTLYASGKVADAETFAASWLKDHPDDLAFRRHAADAALNRSDYGSAVRYYKAMLEIQPNQAIVLNNLAWAAGHMKDPKAIEYAEQADKLAPNNPAILDTLGTLLLEYGQPARGIEMLRKAVAVAPDIAGFRLKLAKALVGAGQKEAAKTELETLAKLGDKFSGQAEVTKLMQGL